MRISSLLFTCAIALSATAAYYSIVGLATIFSGAFAAVIIMASILEISKLVIASWLYQKWNEVSGLIRGYLTASVVVLMMITSLGIFGFLSKAHVEQSLNNTAINLRIEQIDQQLHNTHEVIQRYRIQLEQLDRSINIQLDSNRATQALAARQRQTAERDQIRQRLDAESQRVLDLQQQRLQLRQQASVLQSEVGPIRYVAELFLPAGTVDLEQAVRWMIVVLVLVFDPLAVLMLIAANMSLRREQQAAEEVGVSDTQPPPVIAIAPDQRPLGDVLYVGDQPMRWWNGTAWERFEEKDADHRAIIDAIDTRIQDAIKTIPATWPGTHEISRMVKESMDEWLTQAAVAPQSESTADDTKCDQIESIPDTAPEEPPVNDPPVDTTQPAQPPTMPTTNEQSDKPAAQVKFIEPKPSWL